MPELAHGVNVVLVASDKTEVDRSKLQLVIDKVASLNENATQSVIDTIVRELEKNIASKKPDPTPNPGTGGGAGNKDSDVVILPGIQSNQTVEGIVKVEAKEDTKGEASVSIENGAISEAIKKYRELAKKNGTDKNGIDITVNIASKKEMNSIKIDLPKHVQEKLITEETKKFKVKSEISEISFNLEAVKFIKDTKNTDITVQIQKVDKNTLGKETAQAVGNRPIYDITVSSRDEAISKFEKGKLAINIPYVLRKNENARDIYAIYEMRMEKYNI